MTKTVFWEDGESFKAVYAELCKGHLVLGDSDTVLGLYGALSQQGFDALNACKTRSQKPYLVLVGTVQKALALIEPPSETLMRLMGLCWPGPVTLICKPRAGLPPYVMGRDGESIALRVPDHEGLQRLLSLCEGVFSTSANKAGEPVPDTLDMVNSAILEAISCYVLNARATHGEAHNTVSSTILDCTGERIKLVREGVYSVSLIESQAGVVIQRS